ncbi:hypothetical protein GCM10009104_20290 [Marinobacterium maritimum]|uniref:Type II secretion system protein H n=1 Tax=Marinobacterium maritimum TaxID=500162 RepID=A0ABP3TC65_9GAMM
MRLHHPLGNGHSSCKGFSLLEVMIAIAVLVIVLSIGLPGFQAMFESARDRSATSSFVTAMNLARSEAVTRNTFTRVCATSGCAQRVNEIRVEAEAADGAKALLRTWDSDKKVAYTGGGTDGFNVRFSPLGLAVDAHGDQLQSGLDVGIVDISEGSSREISNYCVGVTGSLAMGGCN